MMKINKKSEYRDRVQGFVSVLAMFVLITGLSIYFLAREYQVISLVTLNKTMIIKKMERQSEFRNLQQDYGSIVDTLFSKIKRFRPSVYASYEEGDIRFLIKDFAQQWDRGNWDKRNKSFFHLSLMYEMWFNDKNTLWAKKHNIQTFKKSLEKCELGLQEKEDILKDRGVKK